MKEIELEIVDITEEGYGVGKKDGKVYFVEGAVVSDTVLCEIVKEKKNITYAKLKKVLNYGEKRIEDRQNIVKNPNVSPLVYLKYEEELKLKKNKVIKNLENIAKIHIDDLKIYGNSNLRFNYRNKVDLNICNR